MPWSSFVTQKCGPSPVKLKNGPLKLISGAT